VYSTEIVAEHMRMAVAVAVVVRAGAGAATRVNRRALGGGRWPGSFRLQYALYAVDEGNIDLQTHEEPASRSAPARPLQT
jgi:hypothetical protein